MRCPLGIAALSILSIAAAQAQNVSNTWVGTTDGVWGDSDGKANWSNTRDTQYLDGDDVIFNGVGAARNTLGLAGNAALAPGAILFSDMSADYTINDVNANAETLSAVGGITLSPTSSGDVNLDTKITGNTSIVHSGSGTLVLGGGAVDNDFIGTITVDGGGTLKNESFQADINSLGDFANTFSFSNDSKFDISPLNGTGATDNSYKNYGSGSFVFGDGTTLTNSSGITARNVFDDELVFAGDVTIDGVGRLDIDGDLGVSGTDIVITLENNTGCVLATSNAGKSIAEWVVNDGTLFASVDDAFGDASVSVNAGGSIAGNVGGEGTTNIANAIHLNGGVLRANQQNTTTNYAGTITVAADSRIDPDLGNRTVILSGVLAESGSGGDLRIGNGTTVIASSFDATGYTGDFLFVESMNFDLENSVDFAQDIVVADIGGHKAINLPVGSSATVSGGITINESTGENFDLLVLDAADTLTVSGVVSGNGAAGITKTGPGSLILSNVNTYTGDTYLYNGSATLADGGRLTFAPTADGMTNGVDGTGEAMLVLGGQIFIDLSGADTTPGNEWLLVDRSTLNVAYEESTFSVTSTLGPFTNDSGTWTLTDGEQVWTFEESDGRLSLPGGETSFESWISQFTSLSGDDLLPTSDPDGDMVDNFTEFAFDGNPEDGANNGRIHLFSEDSTSSDMLVLTLAVLSDTGTWTGSGPLTASSAVDGVDYLVEGSLDLVDFTSGVTEIAEQSAGLAAPSAGYKWQSFKLDGSEGLIGRGFLRAAADASE